MKKTLLFISIMVVGQLTFGQNGRPKTLIGNDPEERLRVSFVPKFIFFVHSTFDNMMR